MKSKERIEFNTHGFKEIKTNFTRVGGLSKVKIWFEKHIRVFFVSNFVRTLYNLVVHLFFYQLLLTNIYHVKYLLDLLLNNRREKEMQS